MGHAVYQPNLRQKSDADIMRDAKMEAMGLRPEDHEPPKRKQNRMATDDMVIGDFGHDEMLLTRVRRSWSVSRSVCESEAPPRARMGFPPPFFYLFIYPSRYLSLGPATITASWEPQRSTSTVVYFALVPTCGDPCVGSNIEFSLLILALCTSYTIIPKRYITYSGRYKGARLCGFLK